MSRNAITRDLHTSKYAMRIVKARKGKGSYNRKINNERRNKGHD